ncbi:putative Tim44-like domain, NTF2-like domain superfamily protein [Helianthus debilis subsp. tardiflorus]
MMALRRLQNARNLYQTLEIRKPFGNWRTYSNLAAEGHKVVSGRNCHCFYKGSNCHPFTRGDNKILRTAAIAELSSFLNGSRSLSTQVKAPAQARQKGALKVAMLSPGIIYEPYGPREPISFLRRWFTRNGWRRTKDDIFLELKNAYAIAKLRKSGYSKAKFYTEAVNLYKEINMLMALGDKTSLRKMVTEQMYSALKSEIKLRESRWSSVYWELIEPVIKIRTLRARMIGVDKDDLSKVFIQLTLEFLSKQKFEAYDAKGAVVAGNKDKEVLVRDIWVFEKSQFHPGAYWRLCGRIPVKPGDI